MTWQHIPITILTLLISLGICFAQEYDCDENTVALWHLNEVQGVSSYDTCDSIRLTLIGTPELIDGGRYGSAIHFNGDDYLDMDSGPLTMNTETGKLTLEAWVKIDTLAEQMIINKYSSGGMLQFSEM